jgi:Protein of unknown function (DUF1653)
MRGGSSLQMMKSDAFVNQMTQGYHQGMISDTDLPPLPQLAPGLYLHYKGGRYQVLGVARCSETLAPLVVYQALYGEQGWWVRPYEMFVGEVEVNGQRVRRFAPLNLPDPPQGPSQAVSVPLMR